MRILFDHKQAQSRLVRLTERFADPTPMLDRLGESLRASTQKRFSDGRAPSGLRWVRSARARKSGARTLVQSGRLQKSIRHRLVRGDLHLGTDVPYAAIHQFGSAGAKARAPRRSRHGEAMRGGEGAGVAARPFLGLDQDDRASIVRIVRSELTGALS